MTGGGWLLMLGTWGAIIAINVFCILRLLKR
jgi:hypothetical protein